MLQWEIVSFLEDSNWQRINDVPEKYVPLLDSAEVFLPGT